MTGAWHGGKGSLTRKEAKPGSYAENYARIEQAREACEEAQASESYAAMVRQKIADRCIAPSAEPANG